MIPQSPDVIGPAATKVLLAVLDLHDLYGRTDITSVRLAVGSASKSTVHKHLTVLRAAGLVSWDHPRTGTLRPAVTRMAVRG